MRAASIAAATGAVVGLVLLAGCRVGAWLVDAALGAWFRWQDKQAGDGHDVWPTDNMEIVK